MIGKFVSDLKLVDSTSHFLLADFCCALISLRDFLLMQKTFGSFLTYDTKLTIKYVTGD